MKYSILAGKRSEKIWIIVLEDIAMQKYRKTIDEDIMNKRKNITSIMDKVELGKEEILEKIQVAFIK